MRISLLGTGNVATHLGNRLLQCGHSVVQVYGRNKERTQTLAPAWGALPVNDLWDLNAEETDLMLMAVSDQAIEELSERLAPVLSGSTTPVAHTSGATPVQALQACAPRCGVFYPLQTFSGQTPVDFDSLPLCYYSPDASTQTLLQTLAQSICKHTYRIDDSERAVLHAAAVFANNFTNLLFAMSEELCKLHGLPFDLLRPLIAQTAAKVQQISPGQAQTGPAKRGDTPTLQKHLELLQALPQGREFVEVYSLLSRCIKERFAP